MLRKKLMLGPDVLGWQGLLFSALGHAQPCAGHGSPPAALLCSPCRSFRALLTFASHTMNFTGNVSAWWQPPHQAFQQDPRGMGTSCPQPPCPQHMGGPQHPRADLLRVGRGNVINRFGDTPWSGWQSTATPAATPTGDGVAASPSPFLLG